jgi:alkanesulfonate monooxygenase SsuD/methylene tetrahydromethanopterin reductase-like flavin-dependent oxidoreductase (luciferase family)
MSVGVLFTQGLVTGDPHQTLTEILAQAEAADRLGFSAALTTEHKYSDEYFGSPIPLSFAIAARTERVRVGTAISIAPLYNPVELAQDVATLDQLSGGRAWLGIGAGYLPVDYSTVGVPWEERAQRMDEAARILKLAWTEDRFTFRDRVHAFEDVSVIPKPLQAGGVPLHMAAWTPGGLRRAGRLGDGWITNALMSLTTMRGMADDYRAAAADAGRPAHVTAIRFCWPSHDRERAEQEFGATALAMARTLFEYGAITDLPGVTSADQITLEEFMRDRFVFGTPQECVDTIGRFATEAGVDDFLMVFRYPTGPDHASVLAAMELFAAEVAPAFAAAPSTAAAPA